ncbi:hypothetical protein V3C99_012256 [Haemonchus contortus]
MYYLLYALTGKARESLIQFEVSGRTYALAVEQGKVREQANSRGIDRLGKCRARTKIWKQGEVIDSSLLQKVIPSKFAEPVHRNALRKKQEIKEGETWYTKMPLQELSNKIHSAIEIHSHNRSDENRPPMRGTKINNVQERRSRNCGSANHIARLCTRDPCRLCKKHGHHTSIRAKTPPSNKEIGTTTATR